jgi:hypothetical protein
MLLRTAARHPLSSAPAGKFAGGFEVWKSFHA